MLDFVRWLAAMEKAQGVPAGVFQLEYSEAIRHGQLDSLQENVLAAAVMEFAEGLPGGEWSGTPAGLLLELNKKASRGTQRSRDWPQNPIALSKRLVPLQAGLATQGIDLEFGRGRQRRITIKVNQSGTRVMLILTDGTAVDKAFYESIRSRVEEVIPAMKPGEAYTVKVLCGDDFWSLLSTREASLAGRCVVSMVKTGQLPLAMVGCEHEYPRRYMI
jgi:hypothetical protein